MIWDRQLRVMRSCGSSTKWARISARQTLLSLENPDRHQAMAEVQSATTKLGLGISEHHSKQKEELKTELKKVQSELWPALVDNSEAVANANTSLNKTLRQISNLATEIRTRNQEKQVAADSKQRTTLILMSVICAITVAGEIIIGIFHYRSVATPLKRLETGVRRLAEGKLSERVSPMGPAEFASLAHDFNRMANELDGFYRGLEEKVAAKSKELVRSERLASVGYLAAGVAHEINNPMGIIAGYAEFSLKVLKEKAGPEAVAEAERSMKVIAEEAFRCKEIVEKLLSLARPGDDNRKVISLADVASNVISLVGGLPEYKDRKLTLAAGPRADFNVLASEGEMKQVILNLTLNALQSVNGSGGAVAMAVQRNAANIELTVTDNGRGMTPQVLEHIFEPFFTAKRGESRGDRPGIVDLAHDHRETRRPNHGRKRRPRPRQQIHRPVAGSGARKHENRSAGVGRRG